VSCELRPLCSCWQCREMRAAGSHFHREGARVFACSDPECLRTVEAAPTPRAPAELDAARAFAAVFVAGVAVIAYALIVRWVLSE
jgi:hypothetical protein